MAESQVPFAYNAGILDALKRALSDPRIGTYAASAGGDMVYAIELYLWNARLAKALMFPLQIAEVTVRNAASEVLTDKFGSNWPFDPGFRHILPEEVQRNVTDTIKRITTAGKAVTVDRIVAGMSFSFWTGMLRYEYDRDIWQTRVHRAFPNLQPPKGRAELQGLSRAVSDLRNRIAHHEPIFHLGLSAVHSQIIALIGLRCRTTARWTRDHSTLQRTLRDRPKLGGGLSGPPLLGQAETPVPLYMANDPLTAALPTMLTRRRGFAVVDDGGSRHLMTADDVAAWVSAQAEVGLADIENAQLIDILAARERSKVAFVRRSTTIKEAFALFLEKDVAKKDRPEALIITENGRDGEEPLGVVFYPHLIA